MSRPMMFSAYTCLRLTKTSLGTEIFLWMNNQELTSQQCYLPIPNGNLTKNQILDFLFDTIFGKFLLQTSKPISMVEEQALAVLHHNKRKV